MVGNTASYTTPQLHSCTIQLNNCSHTASCTVAQYTQFHICTVPQLHSFLHSSTVAPFHSFQHSYVAASQATQLQLQLCKIQIQKTKVTADLSLILQLVNTSSTHIAPGHTCLVFSRRTFKNLNQHTATLSNLCTDVANAASICL